jgi:hypothetical protein
MKTTTATIAWHVDKEPIIEWLESNVGLGVVEDRDAWSHPEIEWSMWDMFTPGKIRHVVEFRDPDMAAMFLLRWG